MFKSARWKSDKNTVKVVFKLQFHAAKVGGDVLVVSIVPADTGKPSVRSDKAVVRDSRCIWENPVYETVKFSREPKSGKILERLYYFAVGTGASKRGFVGEASIDFSSFAEATKVSSVALPLEKSKSEAVLFVSIQRIQESDDQRQVEESESAKVNSKERSLRAQLSDSDEDGAIRSNSTEGVQFNKAAHHVSEANRSHRASSESDATLLSSESGSGVETLWEPQMKNPTIQYIPAGSLELRSPRQKSDTPTAISGEHQKSQWEWLGNSSTGASTDDSSGTPRNIFMRQQSDVVSDVLIQNLKSEITVLYRQSEMSELELQTLRKQIIKESKRGQDLSREIVCLKNEKDTLKDECEKLKVFQRRLDETKSKIHMSFDERSFDAIVEELKQELNHAKELNANLQIQLQKTQESNSELILAVCDLEETLEQKNQDISNLSNRSLALTEVNKTSDELGSMCKTDDKEQKALEELVKEYDSAKGADVMEQQMTDLRDEIEIYKRDKDELEMQMEQLALDYEILKQENHEMLYKLEQSQIQEQLKIQYECSSSYATVHELELQVESLENELKRQSKELSDSVVMIDQLEAHARCLEEEIENQSHGFEVDLKALTRSKIEQEQRAIKAEDALRKTRSQNANTAERLQEEFRRLSSQMASTFEANEKLATKALAEANELRVQKFHLEETIRNASEEHESVRCYYENRLSQLYTETVLKSNEIEKIQSEIGSMAGQLEQSKMQAEAAQRLYLDEISTLKDELEWVRKSTQEMAFLMEKGNDERRNLESSDTQLRTEILELKNNLSQAKCILEEKERFIGTLQADLNFHQSQYDYLKQALSDDSFAKDELGKQLLQLKCELKKRDDNLDIIEKKLKDNGRGTTIDVTKASLKPRKSVTLPHANKEISDLKERVKMLEGQILLKETAFGASHNMFLKKEKDLVNKITELEEKLELLNQSNATFLENEIENVASAEGDQASTNMLSEESRNNDENFSTTISHANDSQTLINHGDEMNLSDSLKDCARNACNDAKLNEMTFLKERNEAMEEELKEMQGRYSEISLKFAEVEGERQKLVIKLRNLKNARKST